MKKYSVIFIYIFLCSMILHAEGQGSGLNKPPDKLRMAIPQAQPNGIIAENDAMPGDGRRVSKRPAQVDLSAYLPPIENQGMIGSCSAWSTIYYCKSLQENMEREWGADDSSEMFSPLFSYNQITNGRNEGTAITDHMAIVVDQGCATMATFPYKYDLNARPDSKAKNEAVKYKAESYESLDVYDWDTDTWSVSLSRVKTLLAQGYPVVVGFTIYENFDTYKGGIYSKTGGNVTGGHAMCIVGYDDEQGYLKIVNSWGREWGDNGFFYLDYKLFEELAQWGAGVLYDRQDNNLELDKVFNYRQSEQLFR